ncbi:MAG: rod shape-determining protein [Candidatus Sericytochromatia bacterium]|nr:rod shape-determining protein [Candidatus Sericytochromatia bacterium]
MTFWNNFLNPLSLDIGMDLGTANTLVYVKGRGVVLNEPSVVAIDQQTKKPIKVGAEARAMLGRTPESIEAIRPLKEGVIADFRASQMMIAYFLSKAQPRRNFIARTRIVIGVPSGITQVEERIVRETAEKAGTGFRTEVTLLPEPLAAAIGAGLPVLEPTGNMIVDIGGGTTEVAVISLGRIVASESLSVAGDNLNDAITQYIRKVHNLIIGERTAEDIKIQIGSAWAVKQEQVMTIKGLHINTGLPSALQISSLEIREALQEPLKAIADCVHRTLEKSPPELAADIMDRGIVLAGGGAMLSGLDQMLSQLSQVPVHVAEQPMLCVALGTGRILEELTRVKASSWSGMLGFRQA